MQPRLGPPTPELIFDTLNAYQRSNVLRGAIELDLFTTIADGSLTVDAIAARIAGSRKGTRVLCDYLTVYGFLTKQGDTYGLTPVSETFMVRKSPAYMADVSGFFGAIQSLGTFNDVAAVVRKGGTLLEGEGTVSTENEVWIEFARSMGRVARMNAELVARLVCADGKTPRKVLDIAAGHGMYGIAVARHAPDAHVVALDWPAVLEVAKENAREAGVADRHSTIEGSAFERDLGSGYDVILLTNFLHHFSAEQNEGLLRRVHAALEPGGRVFTVEFIPNEDRVSPPMDATFPMIMLVGTVDGDAYTFAELERMFAAAGFTRSEMHELAPAPQRVVVSYK